MFIYLATPYRHDSPAMMLQRAMMAALIVGLYHRHVKQTVYSPIAHFHHTAWMFRLPAEHRPWRKRNLHMLIPASRFDILQVEGWRESEGIEWEHGMSRKLGKPVCYVRPYWNGELLFQDRPFERATTMAEIVEIHDRVMNDVPNALEQTVRMRRPDA